MHICEILSHIHTDRKTDRQTDKQTDRQTDRHSQKWMWPFWSQDSKIDCISKMNRWNELHFACWWKFRKAKS